MKDDPFAVETSSDSGVEGGKPRKYGQEPGPQGPLMGEIKTPDGQKKVARAALDIWESRDAEMSLRIAQWKLNAARRRGITSGKLQYSDLDQHWTAWFPEGASPDTLPDSNKAASLCRKFPSILYADPPAPHVEPTTGDDDDEDRAEFTQRALLDLQSPRRLNTVRKNRMAFDRGSDFGSSFIFYYVDPHGAGRIPVEVLAHPKAEHLDNALIDPETGAKQGPYVTRYVRPDGTLTNEKREAATKWGKDLRSEIITGLNVRPIPHNASNIDECYGIQIGVMETFGRLKKRFPDLAKLEPKEREKLFGFEPQYAEVMMPAGSSKIDEKNTDERMVFVLTTIYEQTHEYEEGLYLITLGDCYVAHRQGWFLEEEGRKTCAILPIAQAAQWDEGRDTFYKVGLMEILGGANEVRAAQLAAQLDWLDKLNNQKIFLPYTSVIDPKQLQYPRGTVLYTNPGGEPSYQNLPPYPRESLDMRNAMTDDMNDASGLQEAGQALQDPNVSSGRQAQVILSQVHAGLSEVKQNAESLYLRCCTIELQMARMFLTDTQRMKAVGDDGAHKEEQWRGSDLLTNADISIEPGRMSMLSAAAKAQWVEHLFLELKLISGEEAKEMLSTNIGGIIGLQDDPFRNRIRRQIAEWSKGPPDGWQEKIDEAKQLLMAQQQQAAAAGMPAPAVTGEQLIVQLDPMSGMRVIIDPVLGKAWKPVRSDTLPNVAQLRLTELARLMASTKYMRWSEDWRIGVDVEYERMLQVAQGAMAPQPAPGSAPGPQPPDPNQPPPQPTMFQDSGQQVIQ